MEKISKIVPLSSRMRKISSTRAQSENLNSPELGRLGKQESISDRLEALGARFHPQRLEDRISLNSEMKSQTPESLSGYRNLAQARRVDDVTQRFLNLPPTELEAPLAQEEIPTLPES